MARFEAVDTVDKSGYFEGKVIAKKEDLVAKNNREEEDETGGE